MPRRTRAGTRPAIHEDEPDRADSATPRPETPSRPAATAAAVAVVAAAREPLADIPNEINTPRQDANIVIEVNLSKPARKATPAASPRRKAKPAARENKENNTEVLDDVCVRDPSPAAEEARRVLRSDASKGASLTPAREHPHTPSSRAAAAARKQLLPSGADRENVAERKGAEDSSLTNAACSPVPKAQLPEAPSLERIEGDGEAITAFEDEIAEIGAGLLTKPKRPSQISVEEASPEGRPVATEKLQAISHKTAEKSKPIPKPSQTTKAPTVRAQKPTAPAPKLASGATNRASKPAVLATATTKASSATRPVSLRKAPFVPAKSSRALTSSTFALPGEAVAAKLKARREEREQRRVTGPIATGPIKVTTAATVRGTSFAGPNNRARPSIVPAKPSQSKTLTPKMNPRASLTVGKRTGTASTVTSPVRRAPRTSSANTTSTQLNGTTRHKTKTPIKNPPSTLVEIFNPPAPTEIAQTKSTRIIPASTVHRTSTRPSILPSSTPTGSMRKTMAPLQTNVKPKAKALTIGHAAGSRMRTAMAQAQTNKPKDQATASATALNAAQRARADAAEKGRLASREWAERQRQRQRNKTVHGRGAVAAALTAADAVKQVPVISVLEVQVPDTHMDSEREVASIHIDLATGLEAELDADVEIGEERIVV